MNCKKFCKNAARIVQDFVRSFAEILWRFAEVHLPKLVLLILIIIASKNICVLNLVVVILISLAVCLPSLVGIISLLVAVYLSLATITRVVFLFSFKHGTPGYSYGSNLNSCDVRSFKNGSTAVPYLKWIGFEFTEAVFERDLITLVIVLVTIVIQFWVRYRQRRMRRLRIEQEPGYGIIFSDFNPQNYDHSVIDCLKFISNYGFYKFGLEISMIMMAVVAWIRMDLLGCIVVCWLFIFSVLPRRIARVIWPILLVYLSLALPLQYAMWVGLSEDFCIEYPWSNWLVPDPNKNSTIMSDNLLQLLDLANYRRRPDRPSTLLIADFFLILTVALQQQVFRRENSSHPAGDNSSIYANGDYVLQKNNPTHDFITHQKSFVDYFKIIIFMYGHWITLIMVLVAGLGGTSLFALGYLILAFWMLWQGNDLYTMVQYKKTLSRWNFMLFYTVVVMFFKVALQIIGCVFLLPLNNDAGCIFRQLFSIVCVNTQSCEYLDQLDGEIRGNCDVDEQETRIGFDTIALCFLVFQLRILHSWYFQHCMIDFRCEIVQAGRGALLINQLIEKDMKEQNIQQQAKFDEIRSRTAAIRKQYEEQHRKGAITTFQAHTYVQSKRAGDYYMFNYEPDSDELVVPITSFVPEVTPGAGEFDKLDPAQLLHTAISNDLNLQGTLNAVAKAERIKNEELRMIRAISANEESDLEPDTVLLEPIEDQIAAVPPQNEEQPATATMILRFVGKIFRSFFEWFAAFLNRRSREHRYVAYVLQKEKIRLMNELNFELYDEQVILKDVRHEWENRSLRMIQSERDVQQLEVEAHSNWEEKSCVARLLLAIANCIVAHTDVISFVLACIVHSKGGGLITLPLPLLVFFWGSLASPRPSKNFWIAMITYLEFEIVVKFIFQFGFFPWNSNAAAVQSVRNPLKTQNVLGIQRMDYFASYDVVLLICLFFHRNMLRRLGLWKDANIMDTFIEPLDDNRQQPPPNTTQIDISDIEKREREATTQGGNVNFIVIPEEQRGIISSFMFKLFHPKFRYIRDLYPIMFFMDVFCFFIVVFGFSSFGDGGSGDVLSDLSINRVPIMFVVMLIVISLMIVVDRGLYLRKAVLAKLIYQLITVVFLHAWIFFVLPDITKVPAISNKVAQFLYVVKCIYFIVSAWQIRNGYPQLCIGNLLTHSYGLFNMVLFKIFMLVPFLFELRTAIDWTWTDTSMPILDFFSMENIYSKIYSLKCSRVFEQNFPAARGTSKGAVIKYSIGIPLILLIILIIWFPLLSFSLLNKIGIVLPPEKVQISISLEGYPRLFTMEAQGAEIIPFTVYQKNVLINLITNSVKGNGSLSNDQMQRSRQAVSYVKEYQAEDIYLVRFRPVSEVFWEISSDSLEALKNLLVNERNERNETTSIKLNIDFSVQRCRDGWKEPIRHTTVFFADITPDDPVNVWKGIKAALNTTAGEKSDPVMFDEVFPFFLTVPNDGQIKPTNILQNVFVDKNGDVETTYSSLGLSLMKQSENTNVWVSQIKMSPKLRSVLNEFPQKQVTYTSLDLYYVDTIIFVDRVFPDLILRYAQGGIIAMYVALVLFISRVIRGVVFTQPLDVIISEMPNPDHLLKICLDIYLVREAHDFILEQDLYAKLIFLFRSPATLIKWTRYKPKQG